jgi:hypothetical protein
MKKITKPADLPPRRRGPFDIDWPEKLTARVVTPGPAPRVHGYDAEGDLAKHYAWTETVLLALTGELPSASRTRAFEIAMSFLAPAPVQEAPTHAAVLARICSVHTSAIVGTAAVALAEQARSWMSRVNEPADVGGVDDSVERLRHALRHANLSVPGTDGKVTRLGALLATLRFAGLEATEQQEAAMVLARLPCALAEAFATPPLSIMTCAQLPDVRYTEAP